MAGLLKTDNRREILLLFCAIFFSLITTSYASSKQSNAVNIENGVYIPLDIGIGFGSTWFSLRSLNSSTSIVHGPDYVTTGALRIRFYKSNNKQWIDHIPILLKPGYYQASFKALSKSPKQKLSLKLIHMKCDSSGRFSNYISKKIELYSGEDKQYHLQFDVELRGFYILRIELNNIKMNSFIDIFEFNLYESYTSPPRRPVQLASNIEGVTFKLKEPVKIGAKLFLQEAINAELSYIIKYSDGNIAESGSFGFYKESGFFQPTKIFKPNDYGFYIVTYILAGPQKQVIQKAFSVLPDGDSSFMGLHAYPPNRKKQFLILGRKLGFKHYRDHDMGKFTRWSQIQPGDPKQYNHDSPPSFNWYGDSAIKYIVETLGYNYMGVLYDTPKWAKDHKRALPGQSKFPPLLPAWRKYVRNTVRHYSVDLGLIHDWEIWNEGKGISGKKQNDSTIYVDLMNIAVDEIGALRKEKPDFLMNIVAFAGFNHKRFWEEVYHAAPGFNIVSVHWKASEFRDTYFPPRKKNRVQNKKWTRSGWLEIASEIVQEQGSNHQIWDSEAGLLNQVYPIYDFYKSRYKIKRSIIPISDRSAHRLYDPKGKSKYGPLTSLTAAAVMVKQTIAHKSVNIARCYMYFFSSRDFVSDRYAEQMLEYDGTLMPYTHAFVFCSKLLEDMQYHSRKTFANGAIIRERFADGNGKIIDVMWNEAGSEKEFEIALGAKVRDMMGQSVRLYRNTMLKIDDNPIFVVYNPQ